MKLTTSVKDYIEKNIHLIDNNSDLQHIYEFLDGFDVKTGAHSEDLACILNVLCDVLNVLPDLKDFIKDYIDEVEHAYNSVRSINILNIHPEVHTYWYSPHHEHRWANVDSYLCLSDPVGSKEYGYESFIIDAPGITHSVCWRRSGKIFLLDSEHQPCSTIANLSVNFDKFSPSEFYKKEHLTKFITDYKKYIKDIYDILPLLEDSVRWKSDAFKIAENVATRIKEIIADSPAYCDVTTKDRASAIFNNFNYFEVDVVPYVKTKINLNVSIPYDSDPNKLDIDKLLNDWKKSFEKYIKRNQSKF